MFFDKVIIKCLSESLFLHNRLSSFYDNNLFGCCIFVGEINIFKTILCHSHSGGTYICFTGSNSRNDRIKIHVLNL